MKKIFTFILGVVLLSGCASMSTMQTARTTDEGEVGYSFGGGYVSTEMPIEDVDTLSVNAPMLEVGARYGVNDKLDVGGKVTIIGTAVADAKYQFLGDKESKVAGSAGFGIGYLSMESGDTESNLYDLMVPAYFSYHPAEWLSFYTSPKYVFRLNAYDSGEDTGAEASHWYGAGAGMRIGKKTGVFIEYTYFDNSAYEEPLSQFNAGIGIRIQ